ncbi:vacuolar ATP synthase subunit S1, putative [Pediculus humanus corporis]|uniref:Vacuolar ATP synthase subunit S1, putative n=1 Tax=Pediculus humanus subsp. corporis TaxID=121224 RepID=E0VV03_PEDHC|nr:vacuolar ATP synthase subunit S1, putative [Pediculus humanus corporis]EEB17209.1 vacuolar ATP synthase subunit S1, putative [Pediculus humanus corporis]
MPVLLWSTEPSKQHFTEVSAFSRISSNDFTDYILKKVKAEKPAIIVFMEDYLSVEDFSWRDDKGNLAFPHLKKISTTAKDFAFLPSVENPKLGLEYLESYGYSWKHFNDRNADSFNITGHNIYEFKFKNPHRVMDRMDMLKDHDKDMIKFYEKAMNKEKNILGIYSGNHNSWLENEIPRSKREVSEANEGSDLIITDEKNLVRMTASVPVLYQYKDGDKMILANITKVIGTPTTNIEKDKISMTVRFAFEKNDISVKFDFSSGDNDWWSLDSAEILHSKQTLNPTEEVGAPYDYSYFCNPSIVFSSKEASLTFDNFQVQPRVGKGNSFGPVMHCIPYFSIAIWSGIVIVAILSIVLAWGIVMIMDINTNDRFDDPKGKTITITATE